MTDNSNAAGFAWLAAFVVSVAAWLTHVVVCLFTGSWGLLFVGALLFPIAIVHGIGIWLGVW